MFVNLQQQPPQHLYQPISIYLAHRNPQHSFKMCFVNQSICSGCTTITEIPTPKKPCAYTPDVLQHGCNGKKVVVEIQHTRPEFCLGCYNKELVKIQQKWERVEKAYMMKAMRQGYASSQVDSLKVIVKREMMNEVMRLDQEWEQMWRA